MSIGLCRICTWVLAVDDEGGLGLTSPLRIRAVGPSTYGSFQAPVFGCVNASVSFRINFDFRIAFSATLRVVGIQSLAAYSFARWR
jgi:hypothetical protein